MTTNRNIEIFLDSGAFSAWQKGTDINIKEYIAYIKEHQHSIGAYVSLDVIPGTKGSVTPTKQVVEQSASKSYANHQIMKDAGLSPIPVFHQHEEFRWLERYLADGETYIGISPYLRSSSREIRVWLDQCFSVVCDSAGQPLVKTHGFGMTNGMYMFRFPWYTTDSMTWVKVPAYGNILVPVYTNGKPDCRQRPIIVCVSGRAANARNQIAELANLNPTLYDCVLRYVEDCGLTMVDVCNSFEARHKVMIAYYLAIESKICANPPTFTLRRSDFLSNLQRSTRKAPPRPNPAFKMVFATSMSSITNRVLNTCNVKQRLLSYFYVKDLGEHVLEDYKRTGLIDPLAAEPKHSSGFDGYWGHRSAALHKRLEREDDNPEGASQHYVHQYSEGHFEW